MAIEKGYTVEAKSSHLAYEFSSDGPAGTVLKRIQFTLYDERLKVYNIALGDVQPDGELDDTAITNNADTLKVLATVAFCINYFLKFYTGSSVIAIGNTLSRNRLYRMGITNHLQYLPPSLHLYGLNKDDWEYFKKGENYQAFLITQKPLNL